MSAGHRCAVGVSPQATPQVTIQPLDHLGHPTDKAFTENWDAFLRANNGFKHDLFTLGEMTTALRLGREYVIGGGAAGAFRLTRIPA
jgi:hypothetical protein